MATKTQASDRHTAVTTGWTNPANAWAATGDNVYATAAPGKSATIDGDFGFPSLSLPAGASIIAARLIVEWGMTAAVTGGTLGVQGRNNGVADSAAEVTQTTTTEAQSTFTFGTLPSVTDFNTAGRVVARVRCSKGNTNTAMTGNLDFVRLEVDYVIPLTGSATGTGAASGNLNAGPGLSGSAAGAGTASGNTTVLRGLSGSAAGAGTASGDLTVTAGSYGPVQSWSMNGAASPVSGASPSPVTAGNTLVVVCGNASGSTNAMTVSDDKGNTWVREAFGYATGVANSRVEVWRAVNVAAGTTTITLTTGSNIQGVAFEFPGIVTVSPLDVASTSPSNGGASQTQDTPTITTTALDLVIAALNYPNSSGARVSTHANTGGIWTEGPNPTNTGSSNVRAAWATGAAGSYTDRWTISTSAPTGSGVATVGLFRTTSGGNVALDGSAAGAGTSAGSLGLVFNLQGSAAGAGSVAGDTTILRGLTGSASGVGTASGSVGVNLGLSGAAAGTGQASGSLSVLRGLTGTAAGAGTAAGSLTGPVQLTGSATGTGQAAGAVGVTIGLAATAAGAGQAAATSTVLRGLSGSATGVGTGAGTLSALLGLTGSALGQGTAAAAGGNIYALTGSATGTGLVSGSLTVLRGLSGSAAGVGQATASLGLLFSLTGSAAGSGAITGSLGVNRGLTGSATGVGQAVGSLGGGGLVSLTGSAAGAGTASGTIVESLGLSGSAAGTGQATGSIAMLRGLTGAATGVGTVSASLGVRIPLSGSGTGSGAASGLLGVRVPLTGSALGTGLLTGDFDLPPQFEPLDGRAHGAVTLVGLSATVRAVRSSVRSSGITAEVTKA